MSANLKPGEHSVELNGVRIRYRIAGRGPPLVMQAPGWGPGAGIYEATLRELEKNFTVLYYDPRGSGASGTPADARELNVDAFVADLEALRAHLGLESFALMGHSHGGLIALHYAARHPARVSRLIPLAAQLVGVHADPQQPLRTPTPDENPELEAAFAKMDALGGFGAMFDMESDDEFMEVMRAAGPLYFRDWTKAEAFRAFFGGVTLPLRTVQAVSATDGRYALGPHIGALTMPTLVVAGRFDMFCPPGPASQLAHTAPAARLVVFEESAHFPWLEEPARFFPLVKNFLAGRTHDAPAPRAHARGQG